MSTLVEGDPGHISIYVAASAMALVLTIVIAGSIGREPGPNWIEAAVAAIVLSVTGLLFAKFGARFHLAWWIYYAAPALAAFVIPPLFFRFGFWRTCAYIALVCAAALILHAAFFYTRGWEDYLPFIQLPRWTPG